MKDNCEHDGGGDGGGVEYHESLETLEAAFERGPEILEAETVIILDGMHGMLHTAPRAQDEVRQEAERQKNLDTVIALIAASFHSSLSSTLPQGYFARTTRSAPPA